MIQETYNEVLNGANLKQRQMRLERPLRIRVKSFLRSLIIKPDFSNVEVIKDKYFLGKDGLVLEFDLPPGSYATLVIKRLVGPKEGTKH